MPSFVYTARNQDGIVQSGHLEAVNEDEVVAILQHRGLLVTSISKRELAASVALARRRAAARRMHTRVTTSDQVLFCQQLATLIGAGVPLLRSLEVVSAQVESRKLLTVLDEVRYDVSAGSTFRDALAKHPGVFSKLWLNLVETGEASGHLAQSLQQLSRHFELSQHLQHQAQTALTYPAFLVVGCVAVLGVFTYFIIPRFAGIFAAMQGLELPLLTRIIFAVTEVIKKQYVAVLLGIASIVYAIRSYLRTVSGQWLLDRVVLHLPLFRSLFTYIQLAEFSRGLSTLLESGVPLLSCLEILTNSATNRVYAQAIGSIRDFVKEGKTMAEPMESTGLFPPMAVQMVQVGEEVGELGKMMERVARYYEEHVETFIERMTRLFEPIAIVIMASLVLVIVLSIFLPLFKLAGGNVKF